MSQVDLSQLRINESAAKPRRPMGPRIFGGVILVITLAVVLTSLWPLLWPARIVEMAAVRTANVQSALSTIATAEAVGWVEPDPFPIVIKPLVAGRIKKIHVLEGHEVVANKTVLATLESAELLAAQERAHAVLAERDSEHRVAVANREKTTAHRDQHAEHRKAIANASVAVASVETRLTTADGESKRLTAVARAVVAARLAQERLTEEGIGHAVALERARAEADAANAAATRATAEIATIQKELSASKERLKLHQELLDNSVDLDWAVRIAHAEVERADRRRAVSAADLAIAERELQWAKEVLAPINGVVLRLTAQPGETTGPSGEGIIAIYDPTKLQARLDVALDTVAGISAGQRVELTSEVTGNTVVHGVVQRIQHETDLLKNTLQVKVSLTDPPAIWRPETLCRARFLGGTGSTDNATIETTFLVPRTAVQSGQVFVFDPARGIARAVNITVLGEDGDLVIVQGELSVSQRVITVAVQDGESVEERKR